MSKPTDVVLPIPIDLHGFELDNSKVTNIIYRSKYCIGNITFYLINYELKQVSILNVLVFAVPFQKVQEEFF